jgi:chromosomal replication initiation ATPase DnaA
MNKALFDTILKQILDKYQISKQELYEPTKMPDVVNARYLLYYICSRKDISTSRIRRLLKDDGYKTTYTSVLRGIKAMEKRILEDKDYLKFINSIQS